MEGSWQALPSRGVPLLLLRLWHYNQTRGFGWEGVTKASLFD